MDFTSNKALFKNCEFEFFYNIVEESLNNINSINEFQCFIKNTVGCLIPHTRFFVSVEKLVFENVCTERLLIIDDTSEYIEDRASSVGIHQYRIIKTWLARQKPLLIDAREYEKHSAYIEKNGECKLGVDNLIVHGQVDISGRMAVVFGFANMDSINNRYKHLIEAIAPYIQRTFISMIISLNVPKKRLYLSSKEYEVLKWIIFGKTNKEIGKILKKSDFTVRNQVSNILDKLGADNRSEVMVRAEDAGLLSKWSINCSESRE